MLSEVRHSKIIELLNQAGSIKVSELSKAFQVTENHSRGFREIRGFRYFEKSAWRSRSR